jgi:hypothetical protein
MKIERISPNTIRITESDSGAIIQSQSVEANLQFAIIEKLEEIRCGLIDIEDSVDKREYR